MDLLRRKWLFVPLLPTLAGVALLASSCQKVEQGYWTKSGMSQAQFNAVYRRDFESCTLEAFRRGGRVEEATPATDVIRTHHVSSKDSGSDVFHDCMAARGYEWITMQPLVRSRSDQASSQPAGDCPKERVIVDPFGYPHCAAPDSTKRARSIDVPPEPSASREIRQSEPDRRLSDAPPQKPPASSAHRPSPPERQPMEARQEPPPPRGAPSTPPPSPSSPASDVQQTAQRRAFDESLCIQFSQASLSSPYETFLRCMEDKGWKPDSP